MTVPPSSPGSWENPYLELVRQRSDRIFHFEGQNPPLSDLEKIYAKLPQNRELHIELGSGSGAFLIAKAQAYPQAVLVGFELRFKRAFRSLEKAEKAGVSNLYVIRGDAAWLAKIFPSESLSAIYVNFPDPWDKRRWLKNRLIQEASLKTFHTQLKSHGILQYKTDHRPYFEATLELLRRSPEWKIDSTSFDYVNSDFFNPLACTEFEKLFCSQQLPIYYLSAKKN